jgi:hypothetical protein
VSAPDLVGTPQTRLAVTAVAIVLVVLAAYGGVLDNYFHEIDDSMHVWGAANGVYPSSLFRPLHFSWNRLLLFAFGTAPAGWYAAGLALHALNAMLAAGVVRNATGSARSGAVAGLAFAAFYSGHQAALWIPARCSPVRWRGSATCGPGA